MKSLTEIGIRDLEAVSSRAMRLAALKRLDQRGALRIVKAVETVKSIIKEEEGISGEQA